MDFESSHARQEDDSGKQEEVVTPQERNEEHVLPKNKTGIVTFALACTVFLGALDGSIISTMLPTIVTELHGGQSYSWVGSSYMLSMGALGPLYGKLSDMFGRKTLLYSCIAIFLLGSLLCGAAQNITWLIVCRAVQGMGGGGIVQLSMIVISDIVPLKSRGHYAGILGAAYGFASAIGPVIGGAIAHSASWRWCFFIQLPIGATAAGMLVVFLNLPNFPGPNPRRPLREQVAELDFSGVFSLVAGVVFIFMGLSFGEGAWSEPRTIGLLVAGVVLFISGGFNEAFTNRAAVLPPRLFKTRTTASILAMTFLSNAVILLVVFYLPLFFQVLGSSPIGAGVKLIPASLVSPAGTILAGFIVSRTRRYRPVIWFGSVLLVLGMGLMIMLDYTSSIIEQEIFPTIASIGASFIFQTLLVALQAAMPAEDMATASSGLMFLRPLGGAVGVGIGEAILAIVLPRKLAAIPNIASLGLGDNIAQLNENVSQMHLIPDDTLRDAVLSAWSRSISMLWIVSTAISGIILILALLLREYSVERHWQDVEHAENDSREPR